VSVNIVDTPEFSFVVFCFYNQRDSVHVGSDLVAMVGVSFFDFWAVFVQFPVKFAKLSVRFFAVI